MIAASWDAVRFGWADHLSRGSDLTERERAVRLVSWSAPFVERLAEQREAAGAGPLSELARAAALEPENPSRWERLGTALEFWGETASAEHPLVRAAALSHLYQPAYLLAQYYFRRQNADEFQRWSHRAFERAYGDVTPLLDLAWRAAPATETFVSAVRGSPGLVRRQAIAFLTNRREIAAAGGLAIPLADRAEPRDMAALLGFCNQALAEGRTDFALAVWNSLSRRGTIPYPALNPEGGVSLTNGALDRTAMGSAFDWHVEAPKEIGVAQLRGEWRLRFSGQQPDSGLIAWQYVALAPSRRYRLSSELRASGEGAGEELTWTAYYPHKGTWEEWTEARAGTFLSPGPLARMASIYRRSPGTPKRTGEVALRNVRLELLP